VNAATRLKRLIETVERDTAAGMYDGCEIVVAQHGETLFHEAIGYAHRDSVRPAQRGDVYAAMSISKLFAALATLQLVEQGYFTLTTPVEALIPGFGANGKQRVTVADVLTHTAGLPLGMGPGGVDQLGDINSLVAWMSALPPQSTPGSTVSYSPFVGYSLLARIVRDVTGAASFADALRDRILRPLGLGDTDMGLPAAIADRFVPIVPRIASGGTIPPAVLQAIEGLIRAHGDFAGGGMVTTAADLLRLCETLRTGGTADDFRLLSPAMIALAASNLTGALTNVSALAYQMEVHGVNPYPAQIGLGFYARGTGIFQTSFGLLSSPGTYGIMGAGSSVAWIDPARGVSFVALSAGLMESYASYQRFQRLSDVAIAALD
jgi:CubicO group peptidase (beta-lactamase class C family)